jgi:hypothetical protein
MRHPVPGRNKYRNLAIQVGRFSNETVKYGHEFCGTWTGKWLLCQGPEAIVWVNYRPVLSSNRESHIKKPAIVRQKTKIWSLAKGAWHQARLADWPSVVTSLQLQLSGLSQLIAGVVSSENLVAETGAVQDPWETLTSAIKAATKQRQVKIWKTLCAVGTVLVTHSCAITIPNKQLQWTS